MTASRIRDLNDRFRRLGQGNGRLFVTAGVQSRGPVFVAEAICAVRSDDSFEGANDPYGERDFGVVTVKGPKGELSQDLPDEVSVRQEGEELLVERREQRVAVLAARETDHDLFAILDHVVAQDRLTGMVLELLGQCLVIDARIESPLVQAHDEIGVTLVQTEHTHIPKPPRCVQHQPPRSARKRCTSVRR